MLKNGVIMYPETFRKYSANVAENRIGTGCSRMLPNVGN